MSVTDDLVAEFNAATNSIAARIADLQSQVAAGSAVLVSQFQPIVDHLNALGSDPANPVPPLPEALSDSSASDSSASDSSAASGSDAADPSGASDSSATDAAAAAPAAS